MSSAKQVSKAALAMLLAISSVAGSAQEMKPMPSPSVSQSSLSDAFTSALQKLNIDRKTNRANEFSRPEYFVEFHRFKQIEPYIEFFRTIGIPAFIDDINQQHFVTFEITRDQLAARGYANFHRGDRLVIVFTTTSKGSGDVTSFNTRVFGQTYP
jgi:hypothetical protein